MNTPEMSFTDREQKFLDAFVNRYCLPMLIPGIAYVSEIDAACAVASFEFGYPVPESEPERIEFFKGKFLDGLFCKPTAKAYLQEKIQATIDACLEKKYAPLNLKQAACEQMQIIIEAAEKLSFLTDDPTLFTKNSAEWAVLKALAAKVGMTV